MDVVPRITLTSIGVGAAYCRPGEAQACHLVRTPDAAVCLDLGSGAFGLLCAEIRPEDLDLIVISHLHPDHFIDLLTLRVYMVYGPGAGHQIRVAGPPGLEGIIAGFGGEGIGTALQFEELRGDDPVTAVAGNLSVRHRRVPHLAPTYATRIDVDGAAVCFGADCAPNDELAPFADRADVLIVECTFGDDPIPSGAMHLNADAAGHIIRGARVGRAYLTHCFPEWDPGRAARVAEGVAGVPVRPAEAGVAVPL
jgi:ribonuclease BN (tRNA processing enzyme)